jgi:signal-transduction protein with cAMP-binding, CBS, and nucleotidyltransferase domain
MNRRTNTLLRQKASIIPMFDGIGDGILDRLFQISKIVKFNEEDVVLKAGKTVEDIYMILSGVCDLDYLC